MPDRVRKFLFVSLSGLVGDIAWQVVKEGHEVRYSIASESERACVRDISDRWAEDSDRLHNWGYLRES